MHLGHPIIRIRITLRYPSNKVSQLQYDHIVYGMVDVGGIATLIYYKRNNWRSEHPLNTIAALATGSEFSHVEMAIGEECGASGQMRNVLRVFNDSVGTELTERTGKNPNFVYLQLGCSKAAERSMLSFARQQVGKPFSMSGMFRSVVWPRKTRGDTYFCAGAPNTCPNSPICCDTTSDHDPCIQSSWLRRYRLVG